MSVNRTSEGRKVVSYASQQSMPTMEDIGEAHLVLGQANVRLDPAFASAIDMRTPYLVFITPLGDSNGLYVAQRTSSGFVVREHDGRSGIVFDYRIVAKPYGSTEPRLPVWNRTLASAPSVEPLIRRLSVQRRIPKEPHFSGSH